MGHIFAALHLNEIKKIVEEGLLGMMCEQVEPVKYKYYWRGLE